MTRRKRSLSRNERKALVFLILVILVVLTLHQIWVSMTTNILASVFIGVFIVGGVGLLFWNIPSIKIFFTSKTKIFGSVTDEETRNLIDVIEGIKVQDVRNEEDFEKQLYQRLDAKGYQVQRQVSLGQGKRLDLIVGDKIGIELKVADKAKNIQDLIGQVTVYKPYFHQSLTGGVTSVGTFFFLQR